MLREVNGWDDHGTALGSYTHLKADGSTACGCWIYCGVFADEVNLAARRTPHWEQNWVAPKWAWAWPANRRLLYNRASADPDGKPWSERKRYVWWSEDDAQMDGLRHARFQGDDAPDYVPSRRRRGRGQRCAVPIRS